MVINGWLVDKNANKVMKPSCRNLRDLSSKHRTRILDQEHCDWETLFSSDSLIVPRADEELFNHLTSEALELPEKEDERIVQKTRDLMRRSPGEVKRSFEITCHEVCIRQKHIGICH